MALELAPKGKSMIASLMMGLAFGTGGMIILLVGKLADIFSIRSVLFLVAMIPLLSNGLIFLLPAKKPKQS
jgi:FSR family fosmidomycin resistance protein-like MFS transporter